MSIQLMSAVFKYDMPPLKTKGGDTVMPSTAKFILLALADHANDDGEHIYPSLTTIAFKTGFSRQTVITCLDCLECGGFIIRLGTSQKGTNEYCIIPKSLEVVKSLDQGSQATLPEVVKPLDQGSQATLPESSVNHTEIINETTPAIFEEKPRRGTDEWKKEQEKKLWESILSQGKNGGFDLDTYPEDTRPILEVFIKESAILPMKNQKGMFITEARQLISLGITNELLSAAIRRMRGEGLYIKSPGSVRVIAMNLKNDKGNGLKPNDYARLSID